MAPHATSLFPPIEHAHLLGHAAFAADGRLDHNLASCEQQLLLLHELQQPQRQLVSDRGPDGSNLTREIVQKLLAALLDLVS